MDIFRSYGVRSAFQKSVVRSTGGLPSIGSRSANSVSPRLCTCPECRVRREFNQEVSKVAARHSVTGTRLISRCVRFSDEKRTRVEPPASTARAEEHPKPVNDTSLPSKTEERRWQASKRMSHMMDSVLARASVAGQHINEYTGTDYSGIEALKKQIIDQELKVKESHELVDTARETHHEAHAKQGSSQKEIVSLLERKSSWSPTDLERYMSLVRSEHNHDQAVQAANEGLAAAERDLESSRSLLERLERKQYHEEQIWSDTIRRNSTWVTFGLMGVNIVLLLAQIAIFEPYRRRKIVKEVQRALDEKAVVPTADVEKEIDEVVQPAGVAVEALEEPAPVAKNLEQPLDMVFSARADAGKAPRAAGEMLPVETVPAPINPPPMRMTPTSQPDTWSGRWELYKEGFQDLFSERIVQLKKVDVTTTALQGAATGVAAMGLLFVLFRPR